jgi:protein-L-isoaspartate O-methyltransferase
MSRISDEYVKLASTDRSTIARLNEITRQSWCDASMPERQYVRSDLAHQLQVCREGYIGPPFDAFQRCVANVDWMSTRSVLDVGASGGYYGEMFDARTIDYCGLDLSIHFAQFARALYPGMRYVVGDAVGLPFATATFDLVISGACIMSMNDALSAIREMARVSRRYVLLHRTPILMRDATTYFSKCAYELPTLEIHFNIADFMKMVHDADLDLLYETSVSWNIESQSGHRSYLLSRMSKATPEPYRSQEGV